MRSRLFAQLLVLVLSLTLWIGCNSDSTSETNYIGLDTSELKDEAESALTESAEILTPEVHEKDELLYTWVDELNIRSSPDTKEEKLTKVDSNQALKFIGETSNESETLVLRGVAYYEAWYNVETRIVAFEADKDNGGGSQYAGTMTLNKKDDTKIQTINTFGSCGC
ncbi:MAG: SH3 domain-containing protein [Bacteroidota bacterium]